jgi:hypothetical protein
MNNGLGYKLANVPTITGLSSVTADSIISDVTNTDTLIVGGVDVSTIITQVPINTAAISALQQVTTGISYSNVGAIDLTTIDNNVTINGTLTTSPALATQTYVNTQITNLIDSAPATLDTLNELAAALGDDPNFATTTATLIGTKASLTANQTISGINTLSNPSNVLYGNGANLTGINTSTITVADSNLGTTYYPVMATAGAGSKSLFFDNITSPLSYIPSTGTLQTTTFTAGTASFQNVGTNTQIINSSNGGATQMFCNTAGGAQVTAVSLTATQMNVAVPVSATQCIIKDSAGMAGSGIIYLTNPSLTFVNQQVSGSIGFQVNDAVGGTKTTTLTTSALGLTVPIQQSATPAGGISLFMGNSTGTSFNFMPLTSGAGSYNPTTVAGDSVFFTAGPSISTGNINITTWSNTAVGVRITPTNVQISGNASFASIPSCSIAPTTANHLTNKTYVDTAISGSITNFVTTNTVQTITANKTFQNTDIILSNGGTNTATINQLVGTTNIAVNSVDNTTASITGIIPNLNISCIVRQDAATAIQAGGAITGTNIVIPYTNFFLLSSTITVSNITVTALNTISSSQTLSVGSTMSSFIGTRFVLGTYVTSVVGGGIYTIIPLALGTFAAASTTTIYNALNRPYLVGGNTSGTINFDFNKSLNLQIKDTSSIMQNAVEITQDKMNINVPLHLTDTFSYFMGPTITGTITLNWLTTPLAQFYLITSILPATITLPTPIAKYAGTVVIFKRRSQTQVITFRPPTGGGSIMMGYNTVVIAPSVFLTASQYGCTMITDGVSWFQMALN